MDMELYWTALAVIATIGGIKFVRDLIWQYQVEKRTRRILDEIDGE